MLCTSPFASFFKHELEIYFPASWQFVYLAIPKAADKIEDPNVVKKIHFVVSVEPKSKDPTSSQLLSLTSIVVRIKTLGIASVNISTIATF